MASGVLPTRDDPHLPDDHPVPTQAGHPGPAPGDRCWIARKSCQASGIISEPLRLKPYETDGLAIYRQPFRSLWRFRRLPSRSQPLLKPTATAIGLRVIPRGAGTSLAGGAHAAGRRRRRRHDAHEPHPGHRLRRPLRHGAGRRHQYRHHPGGVRAQTASSTRPTRPPARLHDRRQCRHELRRRALPEIRRHRQQPAGPDRRHHRRRDPATWAASTWTPPATTGWAC